jgi:hypothetical protein
MYCTKKYRKQTKRVADATKTLKKKQKKTAKPH